MLDHRVHTLFDVINTGSFTQAAKKEFRSTVAVMKQITSLESSLGVKLLERTHHGVNPTPAGKYFYTNAQRLASEANQIEHNTRQIDQQDQQIIHIGTSLLRPSDELVKLWLQHKQNSEQFVLHLIPFVDQFDSHQDALLTPQMDCVVTPYSVESWSSRYNYLHLGQYECQIGIPIRHPLASKSAITWSDLNKQQLLLLAPGKSAVIDQMRQDIKKHHPEIQIRNLQHLYDINSFNQAIADNALIEIPSSWNHINPEIKTVPMSWSYHIPYGVLYHKQAKPAVHQFIDVLSKMVQGR